MGGIFSLRVNINVNINADINISNQKLICTTDIPTAKIYQLRAGDKVKMIEDTEKIKQYQEGYSVWDSSMLDFLGKVGVVTRVDDFGRVQVEYKENGSQTLQLNPVVLSTVCQFRAGDKVSVLDDIDKVKKYQKNHHGWASEMSQCIGETGIVKSVDNSGDVTVNYENISRTWVFNPLALSKVYQFCIGDKVALIDEKKLQNYQKKHVLRVSEISKLTGEVGTVEQIDGSGDVFVKYEIFGNETFQLNAVVLSKVCQFRAGDKVKVLDDIDKVKKYQENHHRWNPQMAEIIGEVGTVKSVDDSGDVTVEYENYIDKTWQFSPVVLSKVCQFSSEDKVTIVEDIDKVKKYQKNHGEIVSDISKFIGEVGRVESVNNSGDLIVVFEFLPRTYAFNPDSLKKVCRFNIGDPVKILDDINKVKSYEKSHYGWNTSTSNVLGKMGTVMFVLPDGDLLVSVTDKMYKFNPMCCRKEPRCWDNGKCHGHGPMFANAQSASTPIFKPGDRVSTMGDIDILRKFEEEKGDWTPLKDNFVGKVGIVQSVHDSYKVNVKYDYFGAYVCSFNGTSLRKVGQFLFGDSVKIIDDIDQVKIYQKHHGRCNANMESVLNKIGTVMFEFPDGDLLVFVSEKILLFNPMCCIKIPECRHDLEENNAPHYLKVIEAFDDDHIEEYEKQDDRFLIGDTVKIIDDILKVKKYQELHGGWIDDMKRILGKTAKIKLILPNGVLNILVSGGLYFLNPKCCTKVSHHEEDSDNDSGSMTDMVKQFFHMVFGYTYLSGFVNDADEGEQQKVENFIKQQQHEIDQTCFGKTALHVASHKGHKDIVRKLLEAGANLEIEDEDGDTALHYSVKRNEPEIVKLLLSKGAKIDALNKKKMSALHRATQRNFPDCVQILIANSAPINIQDSFGDTVLHDAIRKEYDEITDILLNNSNIDFKKTNDNGFNVLHYAAIKGNNYATEKILEKCHDIVNNQKEDGSTALHLATLNGHRDVANTLLTTGRAEIDIKNNAGQTPLFLAVTQGHIGLIELLVTSGAKTDIEDNDGNNCLHLAVSRKYDSISKEDSKTLDNMHNQLNLDHDVSAAEVIPCYLVYRGANPYHTNLEGVMPLHIISDQSLIGKLLMFASKAERNKTKICMLCSVKPANVLFQPCCHVLICDDCNEKVIIKNCMKCKVNILNKITIDNAQEKMIKMMCPNCFTRPHNMAFECGHTVCKECGERLMECLMCRRGTKRKMLMDLY